MPPPQDEIPVRLRGEQRAAAYVPARAVLPLSAAGAVRLRRTALALRSLAALAAAIAFLWPDLTQPELVVAFAVYTFVDGALVLSPGGWNLSAWRIWPLLCGGCVSVVVAATSYAWPDLTIAELGNLAAVWAIGMGLAFLLTHVALRHADARHFWFLCSIVALLFGRALLTHLADDVVILSTWLALYVLTIGVIFFKMTLHHYELWLD